MKGILQARAATSIVLMLIAALPCSVRAAPSDSQIRAILVQRSVADYPGRCGCPYNLDRAGHRCGARSAYSKSGGYSPFCFATDVTAEMIEAYRRQLP